ncbi:MAG: ketopantoate reductase family protein [Deltaproteobacteria bacterium]|nr:ketopantoate reductase family protein [Deltaproteobacteria bacterium]
MIKFPKKTVGSMRTVIVGAGAMGCLFGFFLRRVGKDVWLFDTDKELIAHIQRKGIRVEGASGTHRVPISATNDCSEIEWADLIIIFVKSYSTSQAIHDVKSLVGRESVLLTLQNGIGNVERITEVVAKKQVIAGTTAHGATSLGLGHIRHAGEGETLIGELDGRRTVRLDTIRRLFESAGIIVQTTNDVTGILWSKLLVNAGINPLTAITGLRNGQLLDFEETRNIMHRTVDEGMEIAAGKGISLVYADYRNKVDSVCVATADNISSMLQDLTKGKKTEVDFINGFIAKEEKGLTPINRTLTRLIHFIEDHY